MPLPLRRWCWTNTLAAQSMPRTVPGQRGEPGADAGGVDARQGFLNDKGFLLSSCRQSLPSD